MLDLTPPRFIISGRLQLTVKSTIRQRHLGGCFSRDAGSGRVGFGWECGKDAAERAVLGPRFRQEECCRVEIWTDEYAVLGSATTMRCSGVEDSEARGCKLRSLCRGVKAGDGFFESLKAGLIFGRSQPSPAFGGAKAATEVLTGILGLPAQAPRRLTYSSLVPLPGRKKVSAVWRSVAGEGVACDCSFLTVSPDLCLALIVDLPTVTTGSS